MDEPTTPVELAARLQMTDTAIRRWLRAHDVAKSSDGRWRIEPEIAEAITAHYSPRPTVCSVAGCDRARSTRRGMCHMHWQRWRRHGGTAARDGAEHQRAKTHCPAGHEYMPENTYRFADGRRRCRRCRIAAATWSSRG